MKRSILVLTLFALICGLSLQGKTSADTSMPVNPYSGVDHTNYYADSVLVDSGTVIEKTTAASDTSTSFSLVRDSGSLLYIGFEDAFDGFSMDVDTSATGGSYKISYWDGSSWETLKSTSTADIKNNSTSGVFRLGWDRPSDWTAKTLAIDSNEDGNSDTSDSLYFVKMEVIDSYDSTAVIGRLGILDYNLAVTVKDELNHKLSTGVEAFDFSSDGNETVYEHKVDENVHYFAFHAFGDTVTYTVNKPGFVEKDGEIDVDTYKTSDTRTLKYTHKLQAEDADDGSSIDINSATAGDSDVDCVIYSGDAYCAVETDEDNSSATIKANGYDNETVTLGNRTSDDDDQLTKIVEMDSNGTGGSEDTDLVVSDLEMDGDDLIVKVENEGNEDANDDAYLYVYVDDDKKSSYKIAETYLEGDETANVTFTLDALENLDEEVEVKVCIDATDEVDESNENNNCRTETFDGNNSEDQIDFEVSEVYVEDDDLKFTLENSGDKDASGSVKVEVTVEQDGDEDRIYSKTYSSSSYDFFDAGEEETFNVGELLEDYYDDGSDFDVTVCIDTEEDFNDETDEDNNCMTVDDSALDDVPSSDSCGNFTDVDEVSTAEFICALYDRDVVEGKTSTKFEPNASITRAEFLKMTLLGLGYDPYAVSNVYYSDVNSSHWAYSYITYATAQGIVDGYDNGTFAPDAPITRAEAMVLVLRAADQEDYNYDESDIDFYDVNESDWFAWAVVLADDADIVSGYSDDSFRPENNITRGDSAKIVELSYEEYIQ